MRVGRKIILGAMLMLLGLANPIFAGLQQSAPEKALNLCSQELQRCIKEHKPTTANYEHNSNICWGEVLLCPKICVDEYASRIKAGWSAWDANPLYKGQSYERGSCIPGMDEIKFPGRKLLAADSQLILTLEGPDKGKKIEAVVAVKPLDDNDHIAITLANPSRQAHYETNPLQLPLPAGRYYIFAAPRGDYADYREPTSTVTLKKGETLRWTMTLEQKTTPAPLTGQGTLRLVGPTPENPVYYSLLAVDNSRQQLTTPNFPKNGLHKLGTSTVEIPLPSGCYRLALNPKKYMGGEQRNIVTIKPDKVTTQKVVLKQFGQLKVDVKGLATDQKVKMQIYLPGNSQRSIFTSATLQPPLVVTLAAGQYRAILSVTNAGPIYGPEHNVILNNITIHSNHTVNLQTNFPPQHWGTLNLNALFMNSPVTAHVKITLTDQPNYTIYPRGLTSVGRQHRMPTKINLLEGNYLLTIRGRASKSDIFPYPTFERRNVLLNIKDGETLTKTLEFKTPIPSKLTLTVLLNGLPVKANIKGRKTETNDSFNLVPATYNLLNNGVKIMPGTYDLWVQPLTMSFQPGIDIFHGRPGQLIVPVPAKGIKPIIILGIEIAPDSSTTQTVRF